MKKNGNLRLIFTYNEENLGGIDEFLFDSAQIIVFI